MNDWHTCDGSGRLDDNSLSAAVTRRGVMIGLGMGLLSWPIPAIAQLAFDPSGNDGNVLVVLFLRGGADGLSIVVPYGDDTYYDLRPTLAVRDPIKLDGFYGLHPGLSPLEGLYREGQLAVVHACGSDDQTHSHFEAMDTMERGVARQDGPSTGWVARYLRETEQTTDTPLRAVAFGSTMLASLVGATTAISLESLADFKLQAPAEARAALAKMYQPGKDEISHSGRETLKVLETLDRLTPSSYKAGNGAIYPDTDLGRGLSQVSQLVKARVGLEVACLDKGGWDTHVAQIGLIPSLLDDLGKSLAAFSQDLGKQMGRVTVLVMSEFGRRIAENSGFGTDHGHGGVMFALGGGVRGGYVYAKWPGLKSAVGPGDVPVTTDYRDVLGDAVAKRLREVDTSKVLADYMPKTTGLFIS